MALIGTAVLEGIADRAAFQYNQTIMKLNLDIFIINRIYGIN